MDEAEAMLEHARNYLANARDTLEHGPSRYAIAYDEARHAIELAGKVLLLRRTGDYPKRGKTGHGIGGRLGFLGLIPTAVDRHELSRVLDQHTRGSYGFLEEFTRMEVEEVVAMAGRMVAAAESWPSGAFHTDLS